ncbi:MAG TPA: hypothetical protein VHD91_07230 [Gaiellaceae bacterium]|nr:hypothetical protein [Gaiellaceae bacterium]
MRRAAVAFAAALVFTAPALAGNFSFGRAGADHILYRVTISDAGAVTTTGPVHVSRHTLTRAAVAQVRRRLAAVGLTGLPNVRDCPGTSQADWSYVVFSGTVFLQHGGCSATFSRAWNTLAAAVGLVASPR